MTKPSVRRFTLKIIAACAMMTGASGLFAQDAIKAANIVELSGGGATAGTNFENGIELAVKEINASGGILGRTIQTTTADTQSNPCVAKGLTQKAIDNDVFGSGGVMVTSLLPRRQQII